jgi:phenylacetate-CoA ligase
MIEAPCACGNILPRHDRILGRSDDMIIFRGVNLYPAHVDEILSKIQGAGSEYQIHLERRGDGKDYLQIRVERAEGRDPAGDLALAEAIRDAVKKQVLVQSEVEVLDYRTLPRSERKSKRVFDERGF